MGKYGLTQKDKEAKAERERRALERKKLKGRKERCCICKEWMPRVTAEHLRTHGYTVERYDRLYGATRLHPSSKRSSYSDLQEREKLVGGIGERLLQQKVWLECVADEVGERIMTGALRQRLSLLLTTTLMNRAAVHGEAMAVLSDALTELKEEWRTKQGGPNGGPTSTEELLRMVEKAAKVVKDSEEAVQRTIKLALEEDRTRSETADKIGPALYSGTSEKLDMPAGLPAGDRETIRNLLSLIGKAANEAGTVDAEFRPSTQNAEICTVRESAPADSRESASGLSDVQESASGLSDGEGNADSCTPPAARDSAPTPTGEQCEPGHPGGGTGEAPPSDLPDWKRYTAVPHEPVPETPLPVPAMARRRRRRVKPSDAASFMNELERFETNASSEPPSPTNPIEEAMQKRRPYHQEHRREPLPPPPSSDDA